MCGFYGYIYFHSRKKMRNATIRKMLHLQKHRGPDDSGIITINKELETLELVPIANDCLLTTPANLVMAFNRLSILDLSINGHQSMISADCKVVLMMNGEI